MITRTIAVAAALMLFAAPASAFYCPSTGKAIDHAISKNWKAYGSRLSVAQKAKAEELRDQGMALHGEGKHQDAVISLAEAARIILNGM